MIQISEDVLHKILTAVWYVIYNKITENKTLQKNKTKYHENKLQDIIIPFIMICVMHYIK